MFNVAASYCARVRQECPVVQPLSAHVVLGVGAEINIGNLDGLLPHPQLPSSDCSCLIVRSFRFENIPFILHCTSVSLLADTRIQFQDLALFHHDQRPTTQHYRHMQGLENFLHPPRMDRKCSWHTYLPLKDCVGATELESNECTQ